MLSITLPDNSVNHLTLGRTESRLLFFLLSAAGDIKSRNEIIEYVWDDRVVGPGSLNQAIFSLRNILDDNIDHEILITVPRRGYRFNQSRVVPELDQLPVATEESSLFDAPVMTPDLSVLENKRKPLAAIREFSRAKNIVLGYAALVPLVVLAIDHVVSFDSSKIQISQLKSNNLTLNFMAATLSQAWDFKKEAEHEIEKLPSSLTGEVWLLQNKEGYSMSCIRLDKSTYNLSFSIDKTTLSEATQKCLEKSL
ncbi:hypothetical protein A3218_05775 [Pseudomonas chlororaphis]|uniref:transcriptional regulator n=1 Tax=Pseudomonas chlororaphis TaxID=587753 RepID=UPI000789CD14|nr:winged helix-turn-helix domain-containing protein [Pseudomonas chlororaphis]AMS13825.1 hypothetical protein A3218_05775 [Pseudomonas chlororaphis]